MTPEQIQQIRLAEFTALRSEITTFLSLQGQFMNYSIVLSGVVAGLALNNNYAGALQGASVLAFLMSPFLVLGILYGDVRMRILRVAEYIESELRPSLIADLPKSEPCLGWEEFIRTRGKVTGFLTFTEWLRYGIFLLPAGVFFILLRWNWSNTVHPKLRWLLFVVDIGLLVLFGVVLVRLEIYAKKLHK